MKNLWKNLEISGKVGKERSKERLEMMWRGGKKKTQKRIGAND